MKDNKGRQFPLKWEGNYFNRAPVWPREPDIAVIKSLAMEHLASELPPAFKGAEPEISDFAYGAFNKLYLVSYAGHNVSYLFRATLPIVPFYKTESEVATLAYLRAKTSIPVPQTIAWDSSADNDLGFEWILMDKVAGVELRSVWRRMPWERKLELVDELAGFIQELRAHTFSAIGSLYFKSALESQQDDTDYDPIDALFEDPSTEDGLADPDTSPENERKAVTTPSTSWAADVKTQSAHKDDGETENYSKPSWIPIPKTLGAQASYCKDYQARECENGSSAFKLESDDEFVIGPIFSWIFWKGSRLCIPGNRGPYQKCSEWYRALIEMQENWVNAGPMEDDSDYDSAFEEESPDLLAMCQQYLDVLEAVCPKQEDHSPSSLHHHDLNEANILVDPETFGITGIVDWETINILPDWRVTGYPEFINSCDPPSDTEPEIPSYDEGQTLETDTRDQWDNRILRGHFDQAMKQLSTHSDSPSALKSREIKRKFETEIGNITDWYERSKNWLRRYKQAVDAEKKIEEKREELAEGEVGTGQAVMEKMSSAEQNGFNNAAHDEPETDTAAQTAEPAAPLVIITEPHLTNGLIPSDQLTKEEARSPASATTISSWSSTSLEDSIHEVKPGRSDIPEPNGGEKDWMGGSKGPVPLAEVIAKMGFHQETTSSNVSEAGTDYTGPMEEKMAPMEEEEETPISSNGSEAGADHAKLTAEMDQALPVSSNVPEAHTPVAKKSVGDLWKDHCTVS